MASFHHSNQNDPHMTSSPSGSLNVRSADSRINEAVEEHIPLVMPPLVTLARAEIDDLDENDDREVVSAPYPGVDDGFFGNRSGTDPPPDKRKDNENPDVETITPVKPNEHETPSRPRAGPDGGSDPDEGDGARKPDHEPEPDKHDHDPEGRHWRFPYAPGYGPDVEVGSFVPDLDSNIPDVNVYQHKKTLAQGMMDLALFSANANQLRYVLESSSRHPYFYPSLVLISISLIFQVSRILYICI